MTADQPIVKALKLAKKYIEKGWCKGFSGRNRMNHVCNPCSVEARKWCADGAIDKASAVVGCDDFDVRRALERAIRKRIIPWNDHVRRTKRQVLLAFDKAIKLAEKEAAT